MCVRLEAPVRRVSSCLGIISGVGSRHWRKGHTRSHYFMSYILRFRAVRSLPCSVKALVGMEPHAKTPSPPVLSPEVLAT